MCLRHGGEKQRRPFENGAQDGEQFAVSSFGLAVVHEGKQIEKGG